MRWLLSLSQMATWLDWSQELPPGLPLGWQESQHFHCIPRRSSRELDHNWSSQDLSNPVVLCDAGVTWKLNALCHSASPVSCCSFITINVLFF